MGKSKILSFCDVTKLGCFFVNYKSYKAACDENIEFFWKIIVIWWMSE